jgi:hypothetical protein
MLPHRKCRWRAKQESEYQSTRIQKDTRIPVDARIVRIRPTKAFSRATNSRTCRANALDEPARIPVRKKQTMNGNYLSQRLDVKVIQ